MKYRYRSTCRFTVLLEIDNELIQIRPNQIIETDQELNYDILKKIVDKPTPVRKPIKTKKEYNNGKDSIS